MDKEETVEYTEEQIKKAYEKSLQETKDVYEGNALSGCLYGCFGLLLLVDFIFLNIAVSYLIYKSIGV